MSLRVAIAQFSPKIGCVQENIETASKLCSKIAPNSVDLVCLPEMVFTGYVFSSAAAILPYLEEPKTGPTSRFCAELANRLKCHVVAGYPERLAQDEARGLTSAEDENGTPVQQVGANSAVLYGPDGDIVGNYRKTNPFETDRTWAKPGTGFATFELPHPLHTTALGICMDLNAQPPALWTLEDGPYEIADHCIQKKANVLLLLNAWLDSGVDPDDPTDWKTLNYWAARLRPLWARTEDVEDEGSDCDSESSEDANRDEQLQLHEHPGQETIVIICNRCGQENGKTFAGSSAIFSMIRGSGRPKLLHSTGRTTEDVMIWTVERLFERCREQRMTVDAVETMLFQIIGLSTSNY